MKTIFLKRFTCLFIVISILFSFNILVNALDEKFIIFDSEVIPGAPTVLGGSTNITYKQSGKIDIPLEPTNKDVVFLIDSSFNLKEVPIGDGPFDHVLFSRNNTDIIGYGTTVDGKFFSKKTVNNYDSNIQINSTYECEDWNGQPPKNGTRVTGEDLNRFDHWFPDEENQYGVSEIEMLMTSITNNASRLDGLHGFRVFDKDDQELINSLPINLNGGVQLYYEEWNGEKCFMIKGDGTFVIDSDMYFNGNLVISTRDGVRQAPELLGGIKDAFIMATGNVTLQGQEMKEIDDVNLISANGNICIQLEKNQFKGMALAPKGKMEFQGQEGAEFIGSFIGKDLSIKNYFKFKYPEDDKPSDIIKKRIFTESAPLVLESVNNLINDVSEYTNSTTITFATRANHREENDLNVNLGDGLRHAYHHLSSSTSLSKNIVIFTAKTPNTYTTVSAANYEFLLTGNAQGYQIPDDADKAIEYAKKVIEHNNTENIQVIFVDLTEALNAGEEELPDLYNVANSIGISDGNYKRPVTLNEIDFNLDLLNLSPLKETTVAPVFESLTINSATFEAQLPLNFVVTGVQYGFGNDLDNEDYLDVNSFEITDENTITFNIPNASSIDLLKEDRSLKLSKSIFLKLLVKVNPDKPDDPDNPFENIRWNNDPPTITGTINLRSGHAKINYVVKDESDTLYNFTQIFKDADIEVNHLIDLN